MKKTQRPGQEEAPRPKAGAPASAVQEDSDTRRAPDTRGRGTRECRDEHPPDHLIATYWG